MRRERPVTHCVGEGGAVTVPGDLLVSVGSNCVLEGTTVTGDVQITTGADPVADDITVEGDVIEPGRPCRRSCSRPGTMDPSRFSDGQKSSPQVGAVVVLDLPGLEQRPGRPFEPGPPEPDSRNDRPFGPVHRSSRSSRSSPHLGQPTPAGNARTWRPPTGTNHQGGGSPLHALLVFVVLLDGDLWIEMVQSRGMTADSSGKGAGEHAAGDFLVPRVDVGAMGPIGGTAETSARRSPGSPRRGHYVLTPTHKGVNFHWKTSWQHFMARSSPGTIR